jgi:predicted metalloprotease with PDZ domain
MLNGAGVFIYPVGLESEESLVVINKPRSWRQVTSALPGVGGSSPVFRADNYDVLIPYENYTLFVQLLNQRGGGLEHLNSTHLVESRWTFTPDSEYRRFLEMLAHELFHIYNVKRIRPSSMMTYDYVTENYSTLLWFAEGLTSYYDRLLLRRAGLIHDDEYLQLIAGEIQRLESTPGRLVQTLEEASFDSWIKYYQTDENSHNTTISYYGKGGLVGMVLDLSIRSATNGERSLDDVFRALWDEYVTTNAGYDFGMIRSICDSIAGQSLEGVYSYVTTTEEIDWGPILEPFGLLLMRSYSSPEDSAKAYYGFKTRQGQGKLVVTRIAHDTPSTRTGLHVGDELIAIDGYRLDGYKAQRILDSRKQDLEATLIVSRDGILHTLKIRPGAPPFDSYSILRIEPPTDEQETLYTGWLEVPWE